MNALVYLLIFCVLGGTGTAGVLVGLPRWQEYRKKKESSQNTSDNSGISSDVQQLDNNSFGASDSISSEAEEYSNTREAYDGIAEEAGYEEARDKAAEYAEAADEEAGNYAVNVESLQMQSGTGTAADEASVSSESSQADAPLTARVLSAPPNISFEGLIDIPVIAVSASSTINQSDVDNSPNVLFDKIDSTSWQEGVPGYGIGETVSFSLDNQYDVRFMTFKLGNWKNSNYYYGNGIPRTMTIILGDFSGQATFSNAWEEQWVEFSQPVLANAARIVIDDVYTGTTWDDTCISEIHVYGYETGNEYM